MFPSNILKIVETYIFDILKKLIMSKALQLVMLVFFIEKYHSVLVSLLSYAKCFEVGKYSKIN